MSIRTKPTPGVSALTPLPKFVGRDCELSTTGLDARREALSPWKVTQQVLRHVDAAFEPLGLRAWSRPGPWRGEADNPGSRGWEPRASGYSSDCLRRWAPNGQCFYSDMSHVEACTAVTTDPRRFAAQCLSVLHVAEAARRRAQERAEPGTRYLLSAANVDALDPAISWGTHLNVSVSRELWSDLFELTRHPARQGFVSSAIAGAIAFFGTGYLLPAPGGPLIYSLSGRAHHIDRIRCSLTTQAFARGLLNDRHEPHAQGQERLHLIGHDFALAGAALLCSLLQCTLAAAEAGFCGLDLYDPVKGLLAWSWGLDLASARHRGPARLVDGRELTLPQYMGELAGELLVLCEDGTIPPAVAPRAPELLALVVELARYAEEGSLERCARHLDWAAKLLHLRGLCQQHGLQLGDATTRLADHDFASTDRSHGAFWKLWEAGLVDPLVDRAEVDACLRDAPPDGRDWGRGRILQRFHPSVTDVDWSRVELRLDADRWSRRLTVELADLQGMTEAALGPLLEQADSVEALEALLARAGAQTRSSDPLLDVGARLGGGPGPN